MKQMQGFTLVELLITITILGVLSVLMLPVIQTGFNGYFTARNITEANWQAEMALERMTRDIRDIPSPSSISVANSNQLTFVGATNNSVSYTLSGTNLLLNGNILAQGVNSVTFGYFTSAGAVAGTIASICYVTITLNITDNNVNYTLQTTVNLRNIE